MKNKIALVNLRYKIDINFERKESLALGYLAGMLTQHDYSVDIIDGQFFNLSVEEIFEKLREKEYDIIGVSLFEETAETFEALHTLMEQANMESFLCLGGHFASFTAENLLRRYSLIDCVVIGEGENTMLEIAETVPDQEKIKAIQGISYLEKEEFVTTPPRELIQNLNALPTPVRDIYYSAVENKDSFSAIISASRGCYAKCSFCSIRSFYTYLKGKLIRICQPETVVDEIERIYHKYGIKNFFFADDNFFVVNRMQKGWIDTFINEIIKRKLDIRFDMDCRVNDVDPDICRKLRDIGLNGIFLGIESFHQRSLDTYNKNATPEENIEAIRKIKKLRLNVWMGFIMFDMFTTLDEIRDDIKTLEKIKYFKYFNYDRPLSSDWLASLLRLYNGTPLLKKMQNEHPDLLIPEKFGHSFKFKEEKTEKFYNHLQQWKPIVKDMLQQDTLWLIRLANGQNRSDLAAELHSLSRKYLEIDKRTFEKILNAVDTEAESTIEAIIEQGKSEFPPIKQQIAVIREQLQMAEAC